MKVQNLKVEYLTNPLGVDFKNPKFTWNVSDCKKQTAFIIKIYVNGNRIFQSEKVKTSSMYFLYSGEFKSRDQIKRTIVAFDENNVTSEEAEAHFEMGLLNKSDWKASWVTGNYKVNKKTRYPVDCFKKEFDVSSIKKARLYITSLGLYEARINGEKVGTFMLAPGVTNYNKRVQYQTYDVTNLLRQGKNIITIELADGWYRGSVGAWGLKNEYGTETKFIAQLEIKDKDNKIHQVLSDSSWDYSNDGPIRFADNKDGEIVDARCVATFKGKAKLSSHQIIPTASNNVLVEEHEVFVPTLLMSPSGKKILDFHQNIAGVISFSLNAKSGQTIRLRFGEMLDEKGEFTQDNIQCKNKKITTPLQEVTYIAKEGLNEYKTKFAIFGFRYVLIETDVEFNENDFKAIAVYSSLEDTLKFKCSNELINKFVEATRWSMKNNSLDIPTDCPTRERHGWTGDAQIFSLPASYLTNYATFARKYMKMLVDEQDKKGIYPQIVPSGGVDFYMKAMNGSSGWSDAGIIIPYVIFKMYGDTKIIEDNYESMKKYVDRVISRLGKHYITGKILPLKKEYKKYVFNYGQSYGEWAEPDDIHHMTWKDCATPHPEVSTAYASYILSLFSEISLALNKQDEAEYYKAINIKVKKSYQELRKLKEFTLDTNRQSTLVRPLYLKLLNKEQETYAKKRLVEALENYDFRIGTGFLSTPFILYVLENIDKELAYKLLENEKMPGWLYMIKNGSNTIWEAREGNTVSNKGIASLDHYSKGAMVSWLFERMCGVKILEENKFIINPCIGGHVNFASIEWRSIYGLIKVYWEKINQKVKIKISIPSNATALLKIDHFNKELDSGEYEFLF